MDSIQPEQTKPKTSLLKLLLLIAFFPFTLSYVIWKQQKLPVFLRIFGIILLWAVFIGIGSSKSESTSGTSGENANSTATVQSTNTPIPTIAITLEQKQADYSELYKKYMTRAQLMLTMQMSIQSIANSATNKAELYLALDKVQKMQSNIAWDNLDISKPASLKEYKQLDDALMDFKIAGNNITDAIKKMKDYVNKEDLQKLSEAKEKIEMGNARLGSSKDKFDEVAKLLNVDITKIDISK